MRMTARVREIIEMNIVAYYIPLVVHADDTLVFPMYFARIMGENRVVFPATGATGIDEALRETTPASALVVDRQGGYEAYLLEGRARHVTRETDRQLVATMQNEAPGFPIHGAIVLEVEAVHLTAPP